MLCHRRCCFEILEYLHARTVPWSAVQLQAHFPELKISFPEPGCGAGSVGVGYRLYNA